MYMYGVHGCTDGHTFTKISRIYSLLFFLTHGALLKPTQTGEGALESHLTKNWILPLHFFSNIFHEI